MLLSRLAFDQWIDASSCHTKPLVVCSATWVFSQPQSRAGTTNSIPVHRLLGVRLISLPPADRCVILLADKLATPPGAQLLLLGVTQCRLNQHRMVGKGPPPTCTISFFPAPPTHTLYQINGVQTRGVALSPQTSPDSTYTPIGTVSVQVGTILHYTPYSSRHSCSVNTGFKRTLQAAMFEYHA